VNHEDGIVRVEYKHHLYQLTASPGTPDQPLVIGTPQWVRLSRGGDDLLGILWCDSMFSDVVEIPIVPPETHCGIIYIMRRGGSHKARQAFVQE